MFNPNPKALCPVANLTKQCSGTCGTGVVCGVTEPGSQKPICPVDPRQDPCGGGDGFAWNDPAYGDARKSATACKGYSPIIGDLQQNSGLDPNLSPITVLISCLNQGHAAPKWEQLEALQQASPASFSGYLSTKLSPTLTNCDRDTCQGDTSILILNPMHQVTVHQMKVLTIFSFASMFHCSPVSIDSSSLMMPSLTDANHTKVLKRLGPPFGQCALRPTNHHKSKST